MARDNTLVKKSVMCAYCKHWYLSPCKDEKRAGKCPNYMWLKDSKKVKRKVK